MHIVFLTKWYPNQHDPQLGVFVQKHARAVALNHQVTVIYIASEPALPGRILVHWVQNENLTEISALFRPFKFRPAFLSKFLNAFLYIITFRRSWKKATAINGKPSVFHAHILLRTAITGYLASIYYHIPLVITEHWTGFVFNRYSRKSRLYKWLTFFVVRNADAVTTVSSGLREAMAGQGLRNSNFRIVPNVVEAGSIPEDKPTAGARKIILTIADLADENKNISGSLRAMQRLEKQRQDFEFHIIGGGEDEAMLRKLADDLGLEHTRFHGRQDNNYVLGFMKSAAFILTNSRVETFSVATAEALASGKPVVATTCGGPEDFVDERCGILIPAKDHLRLVEALNSMLDNYQNYDKEYMQRKMAGLFSAKAVGNMFSVIYDNLKN